MFAWQSSDGKVCWISGHAGGCLGDLAQPISYTVQMPFVGNEPTVSGVAIDGVQSVTVVLADGQRLRGTPKDNFYSVTLPAGESPLAARQIVSSSADGSQFSADLGASSAGP